VLGGIVFSVAFIEATINEFFLMGIEEAEPYLLGYNKAYVEALKAVWGSNTESLNILQKYELALAVCKRPAFSRGMNPYQDMAAVIKLRNAIVHYKQGWRRADEELAIEQVLDGKFQESAFATQYEPFFPARCLSYGCARWCVLSARAFVDKFFALMSMAASYHLMQMPDLTALTELS
jgi:hypothetical protein